MLSNINCNTCTKFMSIDKQISVMHIIFINIKIIEFEYIYGLVENI